MPKFSLGDSYKVKLGALANIRAEFRHEPRLAFRETINLAGFPVIYCYLDGERLSETNYYPTQEDVPKQLSRHKQFAQHVHHQMAKCPMREQVLERVIARVQELSALDLAAIERSLEGYKIRELLP
jgi:hypothetical protein